MNCLRTVAAVWLVLLGAASPASAAEPVFVEAEAFAPSSAGWVVSTAVEARQASGVATLHGASGPGDATASRTVTLKEPGKYRVWVRYRSHPTLRGPFVVAVLAGGRELASQAFDTDAGPGASRKSFRAGEYAWEFLEAELPAGDVVLRLGKYEGKNCGGATRHVDCLLITTDPKLVPDHTAFGPQTYLRVTFGEGYERPVYLHVFADHYRAPWYAHFSIARRGLTAGVGPQKADLMKSGERSGWCNITRLLYQDSGALLNLSARHSYAEPAGRLRATLEFATGADEKAVVRTISADCQPNGLVVIVPPDLTTPVNRERLATDLEIAERTGKLADAFDWPTFGARPERFPFLVAEKSAGSANPADARVAARERRTLDYMGFTPGEGKVLHGGIWNPRDGSFSSPEIDQMKSRAARDAAEFKRKGRSIAEVLYCGLTDEPTGKPASFLATDGASVEAFRAWLKGMGKTPADLLVADWAAVRPVPETQAEAFPALHYYTQRFRTRSLGDFMAAQRRILEEAYGSSFPVVANFSDGAVYSANFYAQGVDYFELLDTDGGQNAVWGEDWANGSSTYQCAAYNVDLMRAATRRHGQMIGHFLVAYAGRKPWDVKLKAVGEVARGVKTLESFFYGPTWASHEGGPAWKSSDWYVDPSMWLAHAELAREIGAVEDLLVPAKPAPAEVAILYSSSTDAWTMAGNLAYGFDRMHTWLALAHAQVPVDFVSEAQAEAGQLESYKVCYLSGPNLTTAAGGKLAEWVRNGGTLWLTAGAAARDEYNRPLAALDGMLPARPAAAVDAQPYRGSGRYLKSLRALDEVTLATGARVEVLSVRQGLDARPGSEVLGHYRDGSAAIVRGAAGKGTVYAAGFLPGLAYIKPALLAREALTAQGNPPGKGAADADERLTRSANPWDYPPGVRELLVQPVQVAGVTPPVQCDAPQVDAVYMTCDQGIVVPLANYTLRSIEKLSLAVRTPHPIARVESSRRGPLPFTTRADGRIEFALPLEATDFVKLYYRKASK